MLANKDIIFIRNSPRNTSNKLGRSHSTGASLLEKTRKQLINQSPSESIF